MLGEILLLDEREVCVAFHLSQRLQPGSVLFCCAIVNLSLAHSSSRASHHGHVALHATLHHWGHQRLPLGELAVSSSLGVLNHVTVVAEVGVICAAFVLQGLDRRCKVDLAFEKLFALNLI